MPRGKPDLAGFATLDARNEEIVRRWKAGEEAKEIALAIHVSVDAVVAVKKKFGLARFKRSARPPAPTSITKPRAEPRPKPKLPILVREDSFIKPPSLARLMAGR